MLGEYCPDNSARSPADAFRDNEGPSGQRDDAKCVGAFMPNVVPTWNSYGVLGGLWGSAARTTRKRYKWDAWLDRCTLAMLNETRGA